MTAQRWRPLVQALAGVAIAVLIAVILASLASTNSLVAATRQQQQNNISTLTSTRQAATDAARTAKRIRSCTTPGQPCYDQGQRRTAQAVGSINHVVILAAACGAALPPRYSVARREVAITHCVTAALHRKS